MSESLLAAAVEERPVKEAEEYVRRILARMFELDADAYVLVDMNAGTPPNYRLEVVMDAETMQAMSFGEFSGKTDKELTPKQSQMARWSDEVLYRPDVQNLIGMVRDRIRRR